MEGFGWSNLPHHILVDILLYLPPHDRFQASRVCCNWNNSFQAPYLWTEFSFRFVGGEDSRYDECLSRFGKHMKKVSVEVDQQYLTNRLNACRLLLGFAESLTERRLKSLRIKFVGENPFLYAGQEFLDALSILFGPVSNGMHLINTLTHVDLSGLHVTFDGRLFDLLSANNPDLESLNIQNCVYVCNVNPSHMLVLVERCRQLKELCLYHCSLSEEVLLEFTANNRQPLEHLYLICRREDKFVRDVRPEIWTALTTKLPSLRVTLGFDHTCLLQKISEVMKPEIPVCVLRLATYTSLSHEINLACTYYRHTLEKLVAHCPTSRITPDLDEALIELASKCSKLRSLHVFCLLQQETVETILTMHPDMHKNNTYTLKFIQEPHPWIAGKDV